MLTETVYRLKLASPLLCQTVILNDVRVISAHGGACSAQSRRHLNVSGPLSAKVSRPPKPRERVDIPGLEMVTYGDRMHYVPGLAKPINPRWERSYKDPRHYYSPLIHEMPLYKEKTCFVFNQRTNILEGKSIFILCLTVRILP